jgi:DNA-binding NtrC family response regulator
MAPAPTSGPTESDTRVRRVMLIDDEVDLLDIMAEELSSAGYDVSAFHSGRDAIRAASRERFDLAITDLKMPDLDGLETAAQLKRLDPSLPIIVATGYASEAAVLASSTRGIVGWLLKPFGLDQILDTIERTIQPDPAGEQGGQPS